MTEQFTAASVERKERGWNDLSDAGEVLRRIDALLLSPMTAPTTRSILLEARPYIEKAVNNG